MSSFEDLLKKNLEEHNLKYEAGILIYKTTFRIIRDIMKESRNRYNFKETLVDIIFPFLGRFRSRKIKIKPIFKTRNYNYEKIYLEK